MFLSRQTVLCIAYIYSNKDPICNNIHHFPTFESNESITSVFFKIGLAIRPITFSPKENKMKIDRRLGNILLAVYLILVGLSTFGFTFPFADTIMGICAIAAGIIFLIR